MLNNNSNDSSQKITENEISNNKSGEDIIIGNSYKFSEVKERRNALLQLLTRSKQLCDADPEYRYMLEELEDFLKPRPGRNIIGLKSKLEEGNRLDLLEEGGFLENKFARRVSRGQFSISDEIIYFHCLSKINSSFTSYIKPLFKNTVDDAIIDRLIYEKIVIPLYEEVSEASICVSVDLIRGMIFFLTGKCHLRWVS